MTWFLRLFPEHNAALADAARVVDLQDEVNDLQSQNALLKEQLVQSRASETDSYKKLCNVLSQTQFRVKMFPEVDGLPESQIKPEDTGPLPNQHSFMTGWKTARQQSMEDVDRYLNQIKVRREMENKAQSKSLDELAQEEFIKS